MRLQHGSGSILYSDADDGVVFYVESHGKMGNEPAEEEEQVVELSKHFLRQHLIKNGRRSEDLTSLLRGDDIRPLLKAEVDQQFADGRTEEGVVSLYKLLGTLVSILERRKEALLVVEEMQRKLE